jgi:predicted alpha/beta hydrolase family esterase
MNVTTLILPGLFNSGPEHWQTLWERTDASCCRVEQQDWDAPACADWVATLDRVVASLETKAILVGHSSACALVAHWARSAAPEQQSKILGALLVAPSDPDGAQYPIGPTGFSPMPLERLPFASIVVTSDDDEYVAELQARRYASAWGSRIVIVQGAGHINSASGLGAWPQGYALLEQLRSAGASD